MTLVTTTYRYRNLVPGQYQLGNLIMGRGTTVRVENFDIKPYDINAQDYQVTLTDEMRFGLDSIKPTTIEITINILYNRLIHPFEGTIPDFWKDMPKVEDYQREWRSDDIRKVWGQMKPLFYCANDGIGRVIFGRPGQFTYAKLTPYTEVVQCVGEFRRADTLSYSIDEEVVELAKGDDPTYVTRQAGDADTWLRIVGYGPLINPVITIGEQQIGLNKTFAAGEAFEISSYPWQRRAVSSSRENLSAYMSGYSSYLDKLILPWGTRVPVRWTSGSDEATTWVPALGNVSWVEDINNQDYFNLPQFYALKYGQMPVVYYDWINTFQNIFRLQLTNRKYIGPAPIGGMSAVLDSQHQFSSPAQHAEVEVVPKWGGTSAVVIKSNADMTNFAYLGVTQELDFASGKLSIGTGASPTSLTQRAQWTNPDVGGFIDEDKVGIRYDPETNIYTAYCNGNAVLTWEDTAHVVSDANVRQGFIFNTDDSIGRKGPGFANITCYDTAGAAVGGGGGGGGGGEEETGGVFLLYRDAWGTIL